MAQGHEFVLNETVFEK